MSSKYFAVAEAGPTIPLLGCMVRRSADGPGLARLPLFEPCAWILTGDARAMEMEVTMVGLQNAGKTSLLRVLAVGFPFFAT